MKILGYGPSYSTRRALFTAEYLNIPFNYEFIDIGTGAQKSPEYLELNPFGKTPCLVTDQGTVSESYAICRYLATIGKNEDFYPTMNPFLVAQHDQYCEIVRELLDKCLVEVLYQAYINEAFGIAPRDEKGLKEATATAHSQCNQFEGLIKGEFILGSHCSLPDILAYSLIETHEASNFNLDQHRKISRWMNTMEALPAIRKAKVQYQIWGMPLKNAS